MSLERVSPFRLATPPEISSQPHPEGEPCMYTYNCPLFFEHTTSCSHRYPKRQMGWAQFDRRGHVARGLGAIRAVCRLGHTSGKSPGFRNITGDGVPASSRGLDSRIPPGIGFTHPSGDWVYASSRGLGFRNYPHVRT